MATRNEKIMATVYKRLDKCQYCGQKDAMYMTDKFCMEAGKILCGMCFMIADYALPNYSDLADRQRSKIILHAIGPY